jgi:hypothetical protein
MTASVPVVASPSSRAKVQLIPWDPESEEHVNRLYDQRVACGWNFAKVKSWKEKQRKAELGIHWVVSTFLHHYYVSS